MLNFVLILPKFIYLIFFIFKKPNLIVKIVKKISIL